MLIKERIEVILKMHKLTPSAFADVIGVQRSNVSHVLSSRSKPGLDFLEKILISFPRVNAHWLITGKVMEQGKIHELENIQESPFSIEKVKADRHTERIVIFYSDGTYKEYIPSAQ